jgi:hypothetical protein
MELIEIEIDLFLYFNRIEHMNMQMQTLCCGHLIDIVKSKPQNIYPMEMFSSEASIAINSPTCALNVASC